VILVIFFKQFKTIMVNSRIWSVSAEGNNPLFIDFYILDKLFCWIIHLLEAGGGNGGDFLIRNT